MSPILLNLPYEGTEPYVFVSYCHKDADKLAPVLSMLQERGYRIWYDRGIDPGDEWPEVIANHLDGCSVFLAFLSQASMESHNCRREFNFAMMENKPSLAILLENLELTPVMKMQMSTIQAIRYDQYASAKECADAILQMKELEDCMEEAGTVLIPRNKRKVYYLRRKNSGEHIRISKDRFSVGRAKSCDYSVPDNRTVSKLHAVFYLSDDGCAVEDQHSSNGLYVNDDQVKEAARRLLCAGDLIEMGSEQFIFEQAEPGEDPV